LEALKNVLGEFRFGSFLIGVFDAEQKVSVLAFGIKPIENSSSCCADVQRARWAGGQTNAHHCRIE
jgi:hypothetical protein